MRWLRLALGVTGIGAAAPSASAAALVPHSVEDCRAHAPEAALRSGLGLDVVVRVMRAESGGDADAVSPKGAIGCMQIMPSTWADLTARYPLGTDPFNARLNMIGGARYLAELTSQFGMAGAYAAYNAGPTRYIRSIATGVSLPAETVAYVGRLGTKTSPAVATLVRVRWQKAALFIARNEAQQDADRDRAKPSTIDLNTPVAEAMARPLASSIRSMATLFPLQHDATPSQQR